MLINIEFWTTENKYNLTFGWQTLCHVHVPAFKAKKRQLLGNWKKKQLQVQCTIAQKYIHDKSGSVSDGYEGTTVGGGVGEWGVGGWGQVSSLESPRGERHH